MKIEEKNAPNELPGFDRDGFDKDGEDLRRVVRRDVTWVDTLTQKYATIVAKLEKLIKEQEENPNDTIPKNSMEELQELLHIAKSCLADCHLLDRKTPKIDNKIDYLVEQLNKIYTRIPGRITPFRFKHRSIEFDTEE